MEPEQYVSEFPGTYRSGAAAALPQKTTSTHCIHAKPLRMGLNPGINDVMVCSVLARC